MNNKIKEATVWSEVDKVVSEATSAMIGADMKAKENAILSETQNAQISAIRSEAILKGVEIKQREMNLQMKELEMQETSEKINKIVAEVSNMKELTEQRKIEVLQKQIQTEFNTSEPAKIKQWTDIGTDVIRATKGGGSRSTTINQNKNYDNSTTNYE